MAHYAFLHNNIVTEVIGGIDETELIEGLTPEEWYGNFRKQQCVRTSYNGNIRKQFAALNGTYLADADVFVAPQPYPSWILDENYDWQPPTPHPNDGEQYRWSEEELEWVAV